MVTCLCVPMRTSAAWMCNSQKSCAQVELRGSVELYEVKGGKGVYKFVKVKRVEFEVLIG